MMDETFHFDNSDEFLGRLKELVDQGIDPKKIRVRMPYYLPEAEEIIDRKLGLLRYFALFGALAGFIGGLGFTIFTALDWPLNTGGKPIVSLPPFLIIAYLMTILFGSLCTFAGFLLLSRLPSIDAILGEEEFENQFIIQIGNEATKWKL
jgi:Alternative complex III, ActD subunit